MRRRTRKFIGTVLMLGFIGLYAMIVVAVAQGRLQDAPKLVQTLFYAVAGLAWVVPLLPLIRWMERKDADVA
jgi:uncharacterized membrane protein YuzA (DUF378 family)